MKKIKTPLLRAGFNLRLALRDMQEGPVRVHPVEERMEKIITEVEAILYEFDEYFYYTKS